MKIDNVIVFDKNKLSCVISDLPAQRKIVHHVWDTRVHAPEIFTKRYNTFAVDVWAFGATCANSYGKCQLFMEGLSNVSSATYNQ